MRVFIDKLSREYPLNTFTGTTLEELKNLLAVAYEEGFEAGRIEGRNECEVFHSNNNI
jgi:hypothetical protein